MRFTRLLLLLVAAAAIAGIAVPKASALAFDDLSCPYIQGTLIRLCPQAENGTPYEYQVKGRVGTGCVPYVTFKAIGTLPPGIKLGTDGKFTGTPTESGEWTFWVAMQDIPHEEGGISWCSDKKSTEEQFRITVIQGIRIVQSQSALPTGQLNTPYSMQFTATGATNPTWTSQGSLPAGLSLNSSTGALTGTPTATGDFSFKITATAGGRSNTQTYSMTVVAPLKLTGSAPAGEVGIPYQLAPQAAGGKPGYSFTLEGALPAGLTMDGATGAISGTPTVPGASTAKLSVRDTLGLTTTLDLRFNIVTRLLVTRTPLKAAKVGKAYRIFLRSTGGVQPRTWVLLGGRPGILPPGMKLNARTGELSGKPTKAGVYRLRLQVTDALGAHSAAGFVLKVSAKRR
jgi:putative Ig domain-containing protein